MSAVALFEAKNRLSELIDRVQAGEQSVVGNLLIRTQQRRRIGDSKRRELVSAAAALRLQVDREAVAMTTIDALAARQPCRQPTRPAPPRHDVVIPAADSCDLMNRHQETA